MDGVVSGHWKGTYSGLRRAGLGAGRQDARRAQEMNQHEREKIYALQSDILGRLSKDKELLARVSFYPASSVPIVHSIFADEKIAEVIHYRMLEVLSHIFHIEGGKWHACKTCELDRKSTRLNSSHIPLSRMPSSA